MRKIDKLFIHCSATPPSSDIGAVEIDEWHKKRGWSGIGYHWVIRRDGTVESGRPESRMGAHAKGHNPGSIAVCMVGGVDEDAKAASNFTAAQWESLAKLHHGISLRYPGIETHGHNEVSSKACPSFDVQAWSETV